MNIIAFISVQLPYKNQEFSFTHFRAFTTRHSGGHTADLGTGLLNGVEAVTGYGSRGLEYLILC